MVKKVFFNASLPRAGSTLLQNVLMQNPDIYATPTSGLVEFLTTIRSIYSNNDMFKAQNPEEMKKAFQGFCKEGIYGYFNSLTNRSYVIDKSRNWLNNFRFIDFVDPGVKVIVMVRDLRSIFASMEKLYRKNPHKDPNIVNEAELKNMNLDTRLQFFASSLPIFPSLEGLYDSIQQGYDQNILFIRFEDFTINPENEIKRIYNYLEIPYFQHDFNNVEQLTHENDIFYGIFGDHKIKPKIEPIKEDYLDIIKFHNSEGIKSHYQWFYNKFKYK